MRKYAALDVLEAWHQAAPEAAAFTRRRIWKTAHRVAFDYEPRPGYLYVRSRMISSRTNDNHDTFPAEEIEKGYRSFLGKPVFVNHHNANHRRARGVIVAVALHRDRNPDGTPDTWVEGLHEIDAVKFPRLCKAILAGRVNRTSMGVDVDWSTCSACGNKATSPAEYCRHLPAMKGKKIRARNKVTGKVEEKLVHEVCAGLSFFENSLLVEDPADPTAAVLDVPDARGLKGLDMSPRTARADRRDGHVADAVPVRDPLKRELASPRVASADRYQGQKFVFDDPDLGVGELDSRVAYARQAPPLGHHVGRVDCVGAQEPMPHVHADLEVARVADHHPRRYRPAQQLPAVAVRPDARAPRVRQGETRIAAVEGAARPRITGVESWPEVNRGQVPVDLRHSSYEPSVQFRPADHGIHSNTAARRKKPEGKPVRGYNRDPRYDGVGLKRDRNGFYVHSRTNRSRTDSYPTPEDIPVSEIEGIRSSAARKAEGGDHPWFTNHPVSSHHIVASYHAATDDERANGDHWYNDAHHIAKVIGKGDAALGAGLLSAYSPRTLWPINMFHASRAANGDPPGPGTGAMGDHQRKAIRILGGEHHTKVLTAPKTAAFAHLIEHGGDSPADVKNGTERVVIDRHAMSVAVGHRLSDEEYAGMPIGQTQHYDHVADRYREAAHHLSAHYGRKISPHQVQATTWLVQIRKNTEQDASGAKGGGGKGRVQMGDNSRQRWVEHHHHQYPGQVSQQNMHYHGARDGEWAESGPRCVNCGSSFSEVGHAPSKTVPVVCQGCMGDASWHADTAMPGYLSPAQQRDTVGGRTSEPMGNFSLFQSLNSLRAVAYGETRMPPQVDTLRMDECPVCGEHNVWSGSRCPVCGFVVPPSVFRDPDTDKAKEVREQLDATGDVELPPDGQAQAAPQAQDAGLPLAQVGSGEDADGQLVHPDQIAPDGVPTVQGGEGGPEGFDGQPPEDEEDEELAEEEVPPGPEGAVPPEDEALAQEEGSDDGEDLYAEELICPACGTTFETDAAAQPGVPCPACGMAALHPADEDGETPEEQEEDEEAGEETEEEDGAAPPEGAEDPSAEGDEPEGEEDEEDEDKDMPASKTAAALAQAQARRIAELSAQNEVLSAQLRYLASAAGIDRELAEVGRRVMRRQADILNPASPVPDPPQGPPSQTTEQALQPESMDNPGRPGTTPGANSRVPAQQTTTAITPGVEMQTPPATNLVDVTQPVQGTNPSQDGGVPLEQRRIETDVRIDPDPLKAHGPGIGGQGDNGSAFPWLLDARQPQQGGAGGSVMSSRQDEAESSRRTFASIRLAKLRVQAGLDQGEELAVAERIERAASLPTAMIEHEIATLEQLGRSGYGRPQQGRPVQRTAARSVPSLAPVGASMQYAPAAADDLDASDLFD